MRVSQTQMAHGGFPFAASGRLVIGWSHCEDVDVSPLVLEATRDASCVVDAPKLDKGLQQLEKIVTDKGAWADGFNVVFVGHGSEDLQ